MRRFISRFRKQTKNEDGAVMILMAFLIVILLGFAALAIDYGMVYYKDAKLQSAVDIAARAAARQYADIKDIDSATMSNAQKDQSLKETVERYLSINGFPQSELTDWKIKADSCTGEISIAAQSEVELNFARVFTDKPIPISASTSAVTEVTETPAEQTGVDVVFVLDVSSSMFKSVEDDPHTYQTRFIPMIEAVNDCINDIITPKDPADPNNNRISIVTYSYDNSEENFETRVILNLTKDPLNSYRPAGYTTFNPNYLGYSGSNGSCSVINKITNTGEQPNAVYLSTKEHETITYSKGGTYIQYGIATGAQHLLQTAEADKTNPAEKNIVRFPAVFILTDGEPTYATEDWNNPDINTFRNPKYIRDTGNTGDIAYWTILTANYWKDELTKKYTERNNGKSTQCQVYTLGFGLETINSERKDVSKGVLYPKYYDENTGSMKANAENLRNKLKEYDANIKYLGDQNYNYVDQFYKADDQTELKEQLKQFATDVVEPIRTYRTKLTK